jgi:SAM-dependent methyltransferase
MFRSRMKKINNFFSLFQEGMTVLDVGVDIENGYTPHVKNLFLKQYPYSPETYTALGVQDLSQMNELYPGKRFVTYDDVKMPFGDDEFDWVFCNAVVEHVGNDIAQLDFLNELLRVAKYVYFTTPNKYFPIETHSNILFLHWIDYLFFWWTKRYSPSINRGNLNLLSYNSLRTLVKASNAKLFGVHKNRFFGVPMTFTVYCNYSPPRK